jgi:hypothetical protein
VSNVAATANRSAAGASPSSHSRSPTVVARAGAAVVDRRTASARVLARVSPNACVGPPATTKVTPAGTIAGASCTSTTSTAPTCGDDASPAATARATASVLPKSDS